MKLSAMMTTFNDCEFLDASIKSIKDQVDQVVICEGSYSERHKQGISARSTDGTIDICKQHEDGKRVLFFQANEQSDPQQRNYCLEKIKKLNPDGFFVIVDSDEVYQPQTFLLIRSTMKMMRKSNKKMAYFNSLTFVGDFNHYTNQYFPRLFDLQGSQQFINDNYLSWNEPLKVEQILYGQGFSPIKYHHYSFVKGPEKFQEKRNWWMSRGLGKNWDYGWKIDENGQINDKNHIIYVYSGTHPSIMNQYPLTGKGEMKYGNQK